MELMLKIGIPDDYADVVRTAAVVREKCRGIRSRSGPDAAPDIDAMAGAPSRASDGAGCCCAKRTPISAALVGAACQKLRLITISGPYPNIDVPALHGQTASRVAPRPNRASVADPGADLGG